MALAGFPEAGLVPPMAPDLEATDELAKQATVYLNGVAQRLQRAGARKVATQVCVAPSAGPAIVTLALEWNADLVAITSHGRGASRLLVGSVADKVLRGTTASVLLVRTAS
jgi:nucleotide-binding universal stress UspA family protein